MIKVSTVAGATVGWCEGGSTWRDMTTYLHYCYVVSECSGNSFEGLQVIDLSFLPDSVHYLGSFPVNDDGDMTLDSTKNTGLRTEALGQPIKAGLDANNNKAAYVIESGSNTIPVGDGPVMDLYFTIPYEQTGTACQIKIATYFGPHTYEPMLYNNCITYLAESTTGSVTLSPPCCIGDRGNINDDPGQNIDISDLTYFVNFFFKGGATPPCIEASNLDGNGIYPDVSDLTFFVGYFFKNGTAPAFCPAL